MTGTVAEHWQAVYTSKTPDEVSWYEPLPERSIDLIQATGLPKDASIIDVGGGASRLAGRLLGLGYTDLAVADISPAALHQARRELGDAADAVEWIVADVRHHRFDREYDVWHDRAVFHFMVDPDDREGYLDVLRRTLRPGGHLLVATFGPQGPEQCSGLPTARYDADELHRALGDELEVRSSSLAVHTTPGGVGQQFLYAHLRRR